MDLAPFSGQKFKDATVDFVSRYFAPGAGIPEDPVTGSIHATLVPYWAKKLGRDRLRAYQASPRGGWLDCELTEDRVLLAGNAVTFMEAKICLPEPIWPDHMRRTAFRILRVQIDGGNVNSPPVVDLPDNHSAADNAS